MLHFRFAPPGPWCCARLHCAVLHTWRNLCFRNLFQGKGSQLIPIDGDLSCDCLFMHCVCQSLCRLITPSLNPDSPAADRAPGQRMPCTWSLPTCTRTQNSKSLIPFGMYHTWTLCSLEHWLKLPGWGHPVSATDHHYAPRLQKPVAEPVFWPSAVPPRNEATWLLNPKLDLSSPRALSLFFYQIGQF